MLAAPLHWAGDPPLARMFLELGAVSILVLVLWPGAAREADAPSSLLLAPALLLCYPLLYLLPIPASAWSHVPGQGREPYRQALDLLAAQPPGWLVPTVSQPLTEAYWLALLPPVAVFAGVLALSERHRQGLAYLAVAMAVAQSLLGLMQYGAARDSFLCFGADICGSSAHGTYYNYDHLAGLLEMLLPVGIGLVSANMGQSGRAPRYRQPWRERLVFWMSGRGHTTALLGLGSVAMLLGLVFTRSRSGIATVMLGILVCLAVFGRQLGGANKSSRLIGTIVVVVLGLALDIGLAPVMQRFSFEDPLHDSRMLIYSSTLDGIGGFLPLGSGPGTFPQAFRQFQPAGLGSTFVNHAHNDYLEWLFEGGLPGGALGVFLLAFYFRQWFALASARTRGPFRFLQFGAGIGLLLLLLHSLMDFNWHIPANALYAAFLAALFLGRRDAAPAGGDRPAPGPAEPEPEAEPRRIFTLAKPQGPVQNPFDDRPTKQA